jgi:hypothetical protein
MIGVCSFAGAGQDEHAKLTIKNQGQARLIGYRSTSASGEHKAQQKSIDATESFTYHAIYSDCPVAVLHTRLHVSGTL